ncbi:MAG: FlgO family outer membrane protein [Arcobacteraceae bacterium]|jgi:TolB-like protein|nr:FlgO family outer membrane protein [Arcobacteraceae bacterium]
MVKFSFSVLFLFTSLFLFSGCKQNNQYINSDYRQSNFSLFVDKRFTDLDSAVAEISNQLLLNIPSNAQKQNKLILTTFVDLNTLSKTSPFGRVISESLIDELHSRNFKIVDFRMQEMLTINKEGEFSLTRDVTKLKDEVQEAFIVVGTYSVVDEHSVVLNARIMNTFTSDVISTAKVIYHFKNCEEFNICKEITKPNDIKVTKTKILEDR